LFNNGASLARLGRFYAQAVSDSGIAFDVLFGPAYKGIPLVAATAIALIEQHGRNVGYAFNRKEVKDHGERGNVVGTPLNSNRVLIIDDVISAGTSVQESVAIIDAAGAIPAGVVISLDRQERGQGRQSAVQEMEAKHNISIVSIARLDHLIWHLEGKPTMKKHLKQMRAYKEQYGVEMVL
jgi:orotate phosphoribosyltransferase